MTVYDLPHIATIDEIGNPVIMYRVIMEDGYIIRLPGWPETQYKTATIIYPTTDLTAIIIIPASELPEGAEINGGETNEEVM